MQRSGLPRLILCLALAMVVAAVLLHGVQPENVRRTWGNMLARPDQSLATRLLLQPGMSIIFAIRGGIRDARTGRLPYFWAMLSDPAQRVTHLRDGIASIGPIFLIAIALDVIYQIIELKNFHPNETLLVAIFLAFVPYLIVRGPAARLARRAQQNKGPERSTQEKI